MLQIRIGVHDSPKELTLEVDEGSEDFMTKVESGLQDGSPMLWLTDRKGKRVGIPPARLAYVEIEPETAYRSAGFTT
ncbi:MAG: DUF3107 domain-containing protein [Actinomycetota bacterium]